MTAKGRDGCKWPGSNYPWYIYNGIFACFLHGRCTFLLAKTSRSQQIRARVEEGWMMSSTNPGEAQKRKQIICSPRCFHPSSTTWCSARALSSAANSVSRAQPDTRGAGCCEPSPDPRSPLFLWQVPNFWPRNTRQEKENVTLSLPRWIQQGIQLRKCTFIFFKSLQQFLPFCT